MNIVIQHRNSRCGRGSVDLLTFAGLVFGIASSLAIVVFWFIRMLLDL